MTNTNATTLEGFLKSKVLSDLNELFNCYMSDADDINDSIYWVNKKEALKTMSLDELIKENLEYVQQIELAHFIADYSLEWFGEGLTV
jgi:hypothetical protein